MHGHPKEAHKLVPRIEQSHYPVWWRVSHDGITFLHLCEEGVKTAAINYQWDILINLVEPLNQTVPK